ncbi:galactokinase [soil metagenome]
MREQIFSAFQERFGQEPVLVRSPGRVNLIGEHTDYNEGFVLPAAIDKEIIFAVAPNGTDTCRFYSFDLDDALDVKLDEVQPSEKGWANYLLGVVDQMQKRGHTVGGFDCVFGGNIPIGSGLSSSAAVECGLAFGLNHLFQLNIEPFELARISQKAEHTFAGVMCGIMDQFANMFGRREHVVRLDCRSHDYAYYPFAMADYRIVLCDTQVKHSLASTEYNTRRQECEAGVALLQEYHPEVHSLRDVTLAMLVEHKAEFPPVVYRRCCYVVEENLRVELACQDLENGDLKSFGEKMYGSHAGLQHQYEVSCPELDFLVEQAKKEETVAGARMMGGGFGGCTINLVAKGAVEPFIEKMKQAYQEKFNIDMKAYVTEIVDGTSLMNE